LRTVLLVLLLALSWVAVRLHPQRPLLLRLLLLRHLHDKIAQSFSESLRRAWHKTSRTLQLANTSWRT
jgi:hypothetical protein